MKKIMLAILVVLLILAVLGATGFLLYRHFVTNQITDWGGMENPDAVSENEQLLDGSEIYEISSLEHEASEDNEHGIIIMELSGGDVQTETVTFTHQ